MATDEKTLIQRNKASILLDDLIAQVTNCALANDLRTLNDHIMDRVPGFAFTEKQATRLHEYIRVTLSEYRTGATKDTELRRFCQTATDIMNGAERERSGIGEWLRGAFNRQNGRVQLIVTQLKSNEQEIETVRQSMRRIIADSLGMAKDSATYRMNAVKYNQYSRGLTTLLATENQLMATYEKLANITVLTNYKNQLKKNRGIINSCVRGISLDAMVNQVEALENQNKAALGSTQSVDKLLDRLESENDGLTQDTGFSSTMATAEHDDFVRSMGGLQTPVTAASYEESEPERQMEAPMMNSES